jgi:hypothetical protein
MEQVKQTFRFFPSLFLSLLTASPPQSISFFIGNISFLGFIKPMKERMGINVVLFQDFSSL